MAKSVLVLLLLSVLSAGAAARPDASSARDWIVKEQCRVGILIPHNPLATCRDLVNNEVCWRRPFDPALKARCCGELADVPALCRCEALRILRFGETTQDGAVEGGLGHLYGCDLWTRRAVASQLLSSSGGEFACNLRTITGGTDCPASSIIE